MGAKSIALSTKAGGRWSDDPFCPDKLLAQLEDNQLNGKMQKAAKTAAFVGPDGLEPATP